MAGRVQWYDRYVLAGASEMNVALRGGDSKTVDTVAAAGVETVAAADADLLVAIGEQAVLSLAEEPVSIPVLPVHPGGELHAVSRSSLDAALESIAADEYRLVTHPILGLTVDGDQVARAVTDAMLVTSEPARISEYSVRTPDERVERFRADAVVVATPLGSTGYASTVGGSAVASDAGLSVVPVAPFSTGARTWVVRPPLTLTVERDEGAVVLLADDREVGEVESHTPVELARTDSFELVRVPQTGE